jgi:hypothetical protein
MASQALQGVQETLDGLLAWLETKCHLQELGDLVVVRRQLGEAV